VSKQFIESGLNSGDLYTASEQQEQLSYFTESSIQDGSLTAGYIRDWASRKYQTDDYFLNFVKSIFKDENFLLFTKYLRFPLPSAKIIKNKIEPNLMRVLYAENSSFEHDVFNVDQEEVFKFLGRDSFSSELFYHMIYRHNDILIEDIDTDGNAYRYFLDIGLVKGIQETKGKIDKIAYSGTAVNEVGQVINGIIYIDEKVYSVYNSDLELIHSREHNLGVCPADFVSDVKFKNNGIIRESSFTFIREELEEYVFLKTLQKITEPNGAFPVVTKLQDGNEDDDQDTNGGPSIDGQMSGQQAQIVGTNPKQKGSGTMQAGTVNEVPAVEKSSDGSIDTGVVENYVKFHYIPVEVLKNIEERIQTIEKSIVVTIVGDVVNSNEAAKNESQILMGVSTLENKLTSLSAQMSRIRRISDNIMIELQWPNKLQYLFVDYGTSFYLESIAELRKNFKEASNPIERKDILTQINQNKYKNNNGKKARQKLLYDILPYIADVDFNKAVETFSVTPLNMELQLRFNYWITAFESQYGNILEFFVTTEGTDEERLALINNLLKEIITPELPIIKPVIIKPE
tara:strand:+ start:6291 stop:8003 length:1713 start_codon:yes stop_codon:yes gene_type:complete